MAVSETGRVAPAAAGARRRIRHHARDGIAVAAFSLSASVAVAAVLALVAWLLR